MAMLVYQRVTATAHDFVTFLFSSMRKIITATAGRQISKCEHLPSGDWLTRNHGAISRILEP